MTSLASLVLAAVAFVGTHFAMSHPLRSAMVARLSDTGFAIVYSLVSFATFGWMALAFGRANEGAPYLWDAGNAGWIAGSILLWLGSILFVGSLRSNPAFPTPGKPVAAIGPATGVFRITRHPMMWGFTTWAITHALVAPSLPGLILSAAIATLALGGAAGQDIKKAKLVGEAWRDWTTRTSFVPFGRGFALPDAFAAIGGTVLFLAATYAHGGLGAGPWRWLA